MAIKKKSSPTTKTNLIDAKRKRRKRKRKKGKEKSKTPEQAGTDTKLTIRPTLLIY